MALMADMGPATVAGSLTALSRVEIVADLSAIEPYPFAAVGVHFGGVAVCTTTSTRPIIGLLRSRRLRVVGGLGPYWL